MFNLLQCSCQVSTRSLEEPTVSYSCVYDVGILLQYDRTRGRASVEHS